MNSTQTPLRSILMRRCRSLCRQAPVSARPRRRPPSTILPPALRCRPCCDRCVRTQHAQWPRPAPSTCAPSTGAAGAWPGTARPLVRDGCRNGRRRRRGGIAAADVAVLVRLCPRVVPHTLRSTARSGTRWPASAAQEYVVSLSSLWLLHSFHTLCVDTPRPVPVARACCGVQ